ncbi:hypothetical protein K439DRAFT_240215 [Ramaria rubella]|nr:hypothetical protein K439DRAFT_240215 [Ramaria rubella]
MAFFWQLSGPESHLKRNWRDPKSTGNAAISEAIFNLFSTQCESGRNGLDLILGIEPSGASHILIPCDWRSRCKYLNWGAEPPFPNTKYASLSPIYIDSTLKLQVLLEERQNTSKNTKASKKRGDRSKANGRFWDGPSNPARATFEHGRCFWRFFQGESQPRAYGLPDARWSKNVAIFSLALNFWAPDGIKPTTNLIDASVTKFTSDSSHKATIGPTWYFSAEESKGLQNSARAEDVIVSDKWHVRTLPQADIGPRIQMLLSEHSPIHMSPPAPLILLVHDYTTVKEHLTALGLETMDWSINIKELLGFHSHPLHQCKQEDSSSSFRSRSRSPRGPDLMPTTSSRKYSSPSPLRSYAPVYVIDTVSTFKAMSGFGDHPRRIRPVIIYNAVTGHDELDTWCAGYDSEYILQSWKGMVQGPSIDEQRALLEEYTRLSKSVTNREISSRNADSEAPEAEGLHEAHESGYIDKFNDGSDSDEDWW